MKLGLVLITVLMMWAAGTWAQSAAPAAEAVARNPVARSQAANKGLENELVANEKELAQAEKQKNTSFFQKSLADDFIEVAYNGMVFTKPQVLKDMKYVDLSQYSMENFKLRRLGQSAALLTYDLDQQAKVAGHGTPQKQYASSVWISENGQWKLLFHQATPAEHANK